jgi:hypothetical protein
MGENMALSRKLKREDGLFWMPGSEGRKEEVNVSIRR